jgi:hypothetical protein
VTNFPDATLSKLRASDGQRLGLYCHGVRW